MTNWTINESNPTIVDLLYENGEIIQVTKIDFDRAFGAMLNASQDAVRRDFGIKWDEN